MMLKFFLCVFFAPLPFAALAFPSDYETRVRDAEQSGDRQRLSAACKEWYASGTYSPGLLNWNYNALMSVEPDAVLFTQQDNDTYPALMLQFALGVRTDVRVLNLQWLAEAAYRASVVKRESWGWAAPKETVAAFVQQFLAEQNATSPVYFGIMTDKKMLIAEGEKWYLTGLALKYSPKSFDNVAVLRQNIEQRFRLDYLNLQMEPEPQPEAVAQANLSYVPALLLLHRHCVSLGEWDKAEQHMSLAAQLAKAGGKESELLPIVGPSTSKQPFFTNITVKSLEKGMKKVGDRLYAAEGETTNAQYEQFLNDLLKNKEFDQLSACRTVQADWMSLVPAEYAHLPYKKIFEHGHPDGPGFPVQNISHEAATLYCAWATKVYNASLEKKKFKKVLFRLPTDEEWVSAASSWVKDAPYPWGGYFVNNVKGCYLANFNVSKPCGDCTGQKASASNDGGFFPVRVTSYYPNQYGL